MTSAESGNHLSAEGLQALLDDELAPRERARIEEHLGACRRCAAELEAWRSLFDELGTIDPHRPGEGFRDRVLRSVVGPAEAGEQGTLLERLRAAIVRIGSGATAAHPRAEVLLELLDGSLPRRLESRLRAHIDGCAPCASEMAAWSAVHAGLDGLGPLSPGKGFRDRVMAAVTLPSPVAAPTVVRPLGLAPSWRGALAAVTRFLPRSRRAWAALAGVAVAPAATLAMMAYAVLSHPNVTPQGLASFVLWQLAALIGSGSTALFGAGLDVARSLGVDTAVRLVADAPLVVVAGVATYSALSLLALRVLYANLPIRRRHAVTSS